MATQSLYRRYRPRRFSEVKGQDHVVRALRTAVAEGREGQAYLFSGPRGTGKTTSARILAKVLNCENPRDGEPCCECASCVAVERGVSYDVHELDAASNNGVEAIRDLIEKASLGTPGRHRVYILDEVHMLTKPAEAALLKTLEEPPPHVVFVLATTDPQKMSDTVRSRTQHLQFHLLPADTLADHVRWVAADAGLDVSDAAVDHVLRRGGGSARDTLSALELMASTGDAGLDTVVLDEFVEAMIERDAGRALTVVANAIANGSDTRALTEDLIALLRNGFLSLMAPELVQVPSSQIDALASQAQRLGPAGLVRGIEHLGTALVDMRHAPDPRIVLDVVAVQLTADSASNDVGTLLARIERLERQVAEGAVTTTAAAAPSPAPEDPNTGRKVLGGRARTATSTSAEPASTPASEQATTTPATSTPATSTPATSTPAASEAGPAPTGEAISADDWEQKIRPRLRGMAKAVYAPTEFVGSTVSTLSLSVPNAVHRSKCEQQRSIVEGVLLAFAGAPVTVELIDDDGGGRSGAVAPTSGTGTTGGATSGNDTPSATAAQDHGDAPVVDSATDRSTGGHVSPESDDDIDLDDLIDAPPESVKTPIDRLAEAFPGSELVEDAS